MEAADRNRLPPTRAPSRATNFHPMLRRRSREDNRATAANQREAILAALQSWKVAQTRPAWRPVVAPGEPSGSRSKFCGEAWLLPDEAAPICALCGRELQLFLQLGLAELPDEIAGIFGAGMLQLFYCVGQPPGVADDGQPECWGEGAWVAFSDVASLVRLLAPDGPAPNARADDRPGVFPATAIVGWERFDDLPHPEDHRGAGLARSYDHQARTLTLQCPSIGLDATVGVDELQIEEVAIAASKDKLAGWPCWIQGNEQPSCPVCGETMRLLFQLDSEDHVPFMFGDMGIGHITQCPTHHDVVAFAWACS
jgi:hypothetical protein